MLVAVGFGVMGLVTIYSLLFLVVQWAFTKPVTSAEPVP